MSRVAVTFIDEATGEPFARSDLPADQLPESFDPATTLHLGGLDWDVVRASPRTRAECAAGGALTLRLRRVEQIDPSELLFSLPSICDALAALGPGGLNGDECLLAEDEWRQLELVSAEFAAEADAEIAAIRRVHDEEAASVGWRKLHVRKGVVRPVVASLTLGDLDRAFGGLTFRGVGYRESASPVASGFSFTAAGGLQCYGVHNAGSVRVLGVAPGGVAPTAPSADALVEVARAFDLHLVHWCRCLRVTPGDARFRDLLAGRAG